MSAPRDEGVGVQVAGKFAGSAGREAPPRIEGATTHDSGSEGARASEDGRSNVPHLPLHQPAWAAPRENSSWVACAGGVLAERTAPRKEVVAELAAQSHIREEAAAAERERAKRAAPAGTALGNNADFGASLPETDLQISLPAPGVVSGYFLRSVGRDLLKSQGIDRRMRWCGSKISRGLDGVNVYARPDRTYGRVGGVCVCGQSVCCPVCAPRIAAFRSEEVAQAFERMVDAGFEARLETFTKAHELDRSPDALRREILQFSTLWAYHRMNYEGRRCKRAIGSHVAREVNWGDRNGWHYHHHRLRYDEPGVFNADTAKAAWLATLEAKGLRVEGADEHAYRCDVVGERARAQYVAKLARSVEAEARAVGREVSSAATKGRNINQLLRDYAAGDEPAGDIWVNGVACITATKVSSVRWSRGLRYRVGLQAERSDEEIAAEEVTDSDQFLGSLNPSQWRGILKHRAELALLCAANQGIDAVNSFLAGLELGQLNDGTPAAVVVPLQQENCYSKAGLSADVLARMETLQNESSL